MLYFKGSNLICYKCIISGNPCEGRVCIHHMAQVTYRKDGESYYFPTCRHQSSTQLLLWFAALNKVQRSLGELQASWPNKNIKFSANNNGYIITQNNLWHKHTHTFMVHASLQDWPLMCLLTLMCVLTLFTLQLINSSNWSIKPSIKIKNGYMKDIIHFFKNPKMQSLKLKLHSPMKVRSTICKK